MRFWFAYLLGSRIRDRLQALVLVKVWKWEGGAMEENITFWKSLSGYTHSFFNLKKEPWQFPSFLEFVAYISHNATANSTFVST